MSRIRDENFYTVLGWMLNVLELKSNELIVFAIVYSFSQDEESEFTGSLKYLEDFANINHQTAITTLKKLTDKGFIIRREYYMKDSLIKRVAYKANFDLIDKLKSGITSLTPQNKDQSIF